MAQGGIDSYFMITERGSTYKREILAGVTTFMTMAYILIIHPGWMGAAGLDRGASVVVTALMSGLFSFLMGMYAKLPFALAPGMGGNAFFAFTLVKGGIVPWEVGMGMVFVSGVVFVLLTVFGVRELIVRLVPKSIKFAIGAAVGIFIAYLGMRDAGLIAFSGTGIKIGSLGDPRAVLSLIGLFVTGVFLARRTPGGILLGILVTAAIGIPMGITKIPESLFAAPASIEPLAFKLDILGAFKLEYIPFMFTFFVGDFFSTLGTVLGVSQKAGLLDKDGNLPEIGKPFLVDAVGTVVGAIFGSTTITTFIESASGVESGGRTGLTAITTSICFFLAIFLVPLATCIPSQATAPALIIIGLMMMPGIRNIVFEDFTEAFPAFMTILVTAYTASIANGISSGILFYTAMKVLSGRMREVHWGTYILCVPLIIYFLGLR
ncbi:MAG: NCS2 family permease [Eubacteriales bacterium]|uniref:NCS2 family permease n=1 Tax=Aminivibrio sp. TaxID=1872489 RepID=UPI002A1B4C70|nr:NCS2 family permease [Eubacteriales bacterium]MDD3391724.1 NCS2 family permease [Synergistaceae bacterium]MDD4021713.1 NCS2 family permease [Synergistaceae bacterium]